MIEKLLSIIERIRYGPLGFSIGAGILVFTVVWTILQVFGVSGSLYIFSGLAFLSLFIFFMTYITMLNRRIKHLGAHKESHRLIEVKKRIEPIIAQLDSNSAGLIQDVIQKYEDDIRRLQDEFKSKEIPSKPVLIEAGPFLMGSDSGANDEAPRHKVFVDSFLIDPILITNQQFASFISCQENKEWREDAIYRNYGVPYYLCEFRELQPPEDKWDHPIVWVNWVAAIAFCNWRSRQEGKQEVYKFLSKTDVEADFSKNGWRLPTEAEWEKSARAGFDFDYPWEEKIDPTKTNYGNHYRGTNSVGRFGANPFGLFDMIGNVKVWCHDWYDEKIFTKKERTNPSGPTQGKLKVFRGASWMDPPEALRFSKRGKLPAVNTNPDFGFRCVRKP